MSIVCISLVRNLNALRRSWLEVKFLLWDGGDGVDLCYVLLVCAFRGALVELNAFVVVCRILN